MKEKAADMPFIDLFLASGLAILVMMTALWLVSLWLKDASIVDICWGIGFVVVTWLAFALAPGYLPRKQLGATLVAIWGLRLAWHIARRNRGKGEDFRYAKWRTEYGASWPWRSFFQVFLLQGVLMWIISAPLLAAQTSGFPAILTPMDLIGAGLWGLGFLIEALADRQLARFKSNPANRGQLLTTGLWKFSRHPNYFGEAVIWWGFYLIALAAGYGWTVFSPTLMTWLLVRVSGVAMLERTLQHKPGYAEYMRKTSAFIPWFPKSDV
jgi:steroid 5-alpha reductase family enzyme